MDPITQQAVLAAAGAAGGDKVYVDDVFSTFLWTGTGSAQTITNGIDLAGEGGLVWSKNRDASASHLLNDSARGIESGSYYSELVSNTSAANERFTPWGATAFNSNGFSLGGSNSQFNLSGNDYVSWTFRKAPGFFDVVTYTGTGSAQNISHNLGSVPGMIVIKETSQSNESWAVYHRSLGATKVISLNNPDAAWTSSGDWNNTAPTSSVFTVGTQSRVNRSGSAYIAYIFAHDDAQYGTDEDESIIKCGSYTGGYPNKTTVTLGWEPQWLLVKRASQSGDWTLVDNMRGIAGTTADPFLLANDSAAEGNDDLIELTSTGFKSIGGSSKSNYTSSDTFIYMAIRRPNKPPEAATDVFAIDTSGSYSASPSFDCGFTVDVAIETEAAGDQHRRIGSRLMGAKNLQTNSNAAEVSNTNWNWDHQEGWGTGFGSNLFSYMFKRAPGFMDVVAYTGTGSGNQDIPHNLTVVPEMIVVKSRSSAGNWNTYHSALGPTKAVYLNDSSGESPWNQFWGDSSPTATQFRVGPNANHSNNFIAYLFATLPGISKVGSYSGTGSNINVDCGFTSGARFILIKRTDSTGGWYVWDTARGIAAGNDPYLFLNNYSAQVTNTDYVDPLNAGFIVTSSAPAALNASGGTYLFLAIA